MKPVYAVLCEFGGNVGEPDAAKIAADQAWSLVHDWVNRDGSSEIPTTPTGRIDLGAGASATWSDVVLGDRSVRRLVHAIEPSATTPTGWRTIVWICRDHEHSWGVVRSGPENPAGVVTAIRFEAARPRFVGDWIEKLRVLRDGRRLSVHALNYGQSDLPKLLDLLMDPRRQLPVVAISRAVEDGGAQPTLVPPNAISYDLAGNAHVVVVDRRAAWGLTEALGGELSVYNGAIRVWWPGFTLDDEPALHRLWMPGQIAEDAERTRRQVSGWIWRAAVDAIGPPGLESRIAADLSRAATDRRVAELRTKLEEVENSLTDGATTVSSEFLQEFEAQLHENDRLIDLLAEKDVLVDELRESLDLAKSGAEESADEGVTEVESVEEAVRQAAAEATNVVYLHSAFEAARESEYPNPQQVLKDLRALGRVAARWADGSLGGDFRVGFSEEGVRFQPGISQYAQSRYRSDYEIDFGGRGCIMGPHLRRGIGSPIAILRIYWYVDDATKQLIVGHVGRKLRDASNP